MPQEDYRGRLGDARRAPRGPARGTIMKTKAAIRRAAPAVIRKCLDGRAGGFSTQEVFDAVPEFASSYRTSNALGTALGDGVRGSGLGLHRDAEGTFRRCRDNAALAAAALDDDEFAALADELGLAGPEALAEAIDRLPPAPAA